MGQFCHQKDVAGFGKGVCVCVCVCSEESVVWAALTQLAALQSGQILDGQRAANDARTEQQKQKPRAGSSLPAALSKGDAEVWGQTDPLSSNPRGKGEALLGWGGGTQESELELPGSVVITAQVLGL